MTSIPATTNPSLNASQLNQLLVPKIVYGKSTAVQNNLLLRDYNYLRSSLISFYFTLQRKAQRRMPSLSPYRLLTNQGAPFTLSGAQQISLYWYIASNTGSGLASLISRARYFQNCINLVKSRSINQP